MKKYLLIFTISFVTICLLLSGCKKDSKKFSSDNLAVYDTKTRQTIKLGDKREVIEKYIGSGDEKNQEYGIADVCCQYGDYVYSSLSISDDRELKIEYNNDIAIGFTLNSCWKEENNRFELPSGAKITSGVTKFQECYPGFIETQNDGLNHYSSELHLKLNKDFFEIGNYSKEDYDKIRNETFSKAMIEDKSIGYNVEKSKKIELNYMKQWAYISAEYNNYEKIDVIEIGYGWN